MVEMFQKGQDNEKVESLKQKLYYLVIAESESHPLLCDSVKTDLTRFMT